MKRRDSLHAVHCEIVFPILRKKGLQQKPAGEVIFHDKWAHHRFPPKTQSTHRFNQATGSINSQDQSSHPNCFSVALSNLNCSSSLGRRARAWFRFFEAAASCISKQSARRASADSVAAAPLKIGR